MTDQGDVTEVIITCFADSVDMCILVLELDLDFLDLTTKQMGKMPLCFSDSLIS